MPCWTTNGGNEDGLKTARERERDEAGLWPMMQGQELAVSVWQSNGEEREKRARGAAAVRLAEQGNERVNAAAKAFAAASPRAQSPGQKATNLQ
jgi:hypothetical protein